MIDSRWISGSSIFEGAARGVERMARWGLLNWVCFSWVGGGGNVRKALWSKGLGWFRGFGDWVRFARKGYGFVGFLRVVDSCQRVDCGRRICGVGGCAARGVERMARWGLGLNWVCFLRIRGGDNLCKAFWGKGLGWFWCFGDWVCFA